MPFLKKKPVSPAFQIDSPMFSITPYSQDIESLLCKAKIEYKNVTNGYVTFAGKAFKSDIPLMIGIHFSPSKVKYIEIFRPYEYYKVDNYDITASFNELSKVLQKEYGNPIITSAASIGGYPCEQWHTPDYFINHYIMDRFGPEEHLHINFYNK